MGGQIGQVGGLAVVDPFDDARQVTAFGLVDVQAEFFGESSAQGMMDVVAHPRHCRRRSVVGGVGAVAADEGDIVAAEDGIESSKRLRAGEGHRMDHVLAVRLVAAGRSDLAVADRGQGAVHDPQPPVRHIGRAAAAGRASGSTGSWRTV
jgi:hypothetical protein